MILLRSLCVVPPTPTNQEAGSLAKGISSTPLDVHRQDRHTAGRAKPRAYRLGGVKMPTDSPHRATVPDLKPKIKLECNLTNASATVNGSVLTLPLGVLLPN